MTEQEQQTQNEREALLETAKRFDRAAQLYRDLACGRIKSGTDACIIHRPMMVMLMRELMNEWV